MENLEWEIYTLDNLSKALYTKRGKIVARNGNIQPHDNSNYNSNYIHIILIIHLQAESVESCR